MNNNNSILLNFTVYVKKDTQTDRHRSTFHYKYTYYLGKQIINNAQEVFIPKLKAWWHSKKVIAVFVPQLV